MRPVLIPSNIVAAEYRARTDSQLASMTAELKRSRGAHLGEALAAAALDWTTALTAATLPEEHAYPRVYMALSALLDAICGAPSAHGWTMAVIRYEQLLLSELGFGLALDQCAVTGKETDLIYISPKSGAAISRSAGHDYRNKLLPLPEFLTGAGQAGLGDASWEDIFAALRVTGFFLDRHFFADRRTDIMATRTMLVDRLKRVVA